MRQLLLCIIAGTTCAILGGCDGAGAESSPSDAGSDAGTDADADVVVVPPGDGGGDGGSSGPCTITLSGAVSKTLACSVTATFDSQGNQSAVAVLSVGGAGGAPEATFVLTITGELQAITYTWANSDEQSGAVTQPAPGWDVTLVGAKGSSSVTLGSVSTLTSLPDGKLYTVSGSVTATLVPQDTGADVEMTVTF